MLQNHIIRWESRDHPGSIGSEDLRGSEEEFEFKIEPGREESKSRKVAEV